MTEDIPQAYRRKYIALGEQQATRKAYAHFERELEQLTSSADVEASIISLLSTVRAKHDAADAALKGKTPTASAASEPGLMTSPAMVEAMRAGPRAGESAEQAAARIIREHGPAGTDTTQGAAPATQITAEEHEEKVVAEVERLMGVST